MGLRQESSGVWTSGKGDRGDEKECICRNRKDLGARRLEIGDNTVQGMLGTGG